MRSHSHSVPEAKRILAGREGGRRTAGFCLGALAVVGVAACGKADEADDFRAGVPQHEDVSLAFPGEDSATGALTAEGVATAHGALLGEKAEMYTLTRTITAVANGGTVKVLALLSAITQFPASSVGPNVAIWGPHTDPLSPNTWRLTVNRVAAGKFDYVFEAKDKSAADSAYVTVLSGHHEMTDPTARRRLHLPAFGHGNFVLDWDAAKTLPEHDTNVGKGAFTYSRPMPQSEATIQVQFTQVRDDQTGLLVDATYAYSESPGAGGSFDFSVTKDAIPTTPALETLTVRSRWMQTGAGRADTKLSGGDVGATAATANECWDASFASVYQTNSYGDTSKIWGAEASCAFATPEYFTLL